MEIYNTVVRYDNPIDETINQINIEELVDNVIEKIDNKKIDNNTDDNFENYSKECIVTDIDNEKKHSECTICTESISDSSSDHESENFKCNTCSNRVHPICVYNYGIYHQLDDLNSVPCYVCEKGTLTPNNSIGKRLKSIANKIRQTSSHDTENSRIENNLHQHLLGNNSPTTNRREILERSGYFEEENSDNGDNDENSENSENSYNSDNNETTIEISYTPEHENSVFIDSRLECCFSIIKIIFIFICFTCCIFTIVAYFTFKDSAY